MTQASNQRTDRTRRRLFVSAVLLAGLVSPSCHLFDAEEKIPVPFESMEEAAYLCVPEPLTQIFRDAAEWTELWEQHSAEPAPDVEFGREMVVGLFWGGGYSGCSNRADVVRSVTELTSEVKVDVDPLNDLGDCDMIVCPAQLIRLPRIDKPFRFVGEVPE